MDHVRQPKAIFPLHSMLKSSIVAAQRSSIVPLSVHLPREQRERLSQGTMWPVIALPSVRRSSQSREARDGRLSSFGLFSSLFQSRRGDLPSSERAANAVARKIFKTSHGLCYDRIKSDLRGWKCYLSTSKKHWKRPNIKF